MHSKILLYKNYIKKLKNSGMRSLLTIFGLAVSVAAVFVALSNAESIIESNYDKIKPYKDHAATVISATYDYSLFDSVRENIPGNTFFEAELGVARFVNNVAVNGVERSVLFSMVGVNAIPEGFICETETDYANRKNDRIIAGRSITAEDIRDCSNVAVITDICAEILFGEYEKALGQTIPVSSSNTDGSRVKKQVEVVGILSTSREYREQIGQRMNEISGNLSFMLFMPMTTRINDQPLDYAMMRIINFGENGKDNSAALVLLADEYCPGNYTLYNYSTERKLTEIQTSDASESMRSLIIVLIVFVGIMTSTIMFFSVKERVGEIGIRRSIGAFGHDIVEQIMFEGLIYGVIGAVIGCAAGYLITASLYIINESYLSWGIRFVVSRENLILSGCLSVLVSMLSSVIPAVYASRINITEAFRNE